MATTNEHGERRNIGLELAQNKISFSGVDRVTGETVSLKKADLLLRVSGPHAGTLLVREDGDIRKASDAENRVAGSHVNQLQDLQEMAKTNAA